MNASDEPIFRFPIRVYYEDTDLSGIVYHANYLRYMERGRTEMLRANGIDQTGLAKMDRYLAIRSVSLSFKAPARIDDALTVVTELVSSTGARGEIKQSVWREDTLLCEGEMTVVCIRADGRPARIPPEALALFPET